MVFGVKVSTKVEDCEKSDMPLINSLFPAVKGGKLKAYLFDIF